MWPVQCWTGGRGSRDEPPQRIELRIWAGIFIEACGTKSIALLESVMNSCSSFYFLLLILLHLL